MFIRGISPNRAFSSLLATALLLTVSTGAHAQDSLHAWTVGADPAALETWVNARLAAVKADIDKVTAVKGDHTVANTVRPYDDAQNELTLAGSEAYLMYAVGDAAPLSDNSSQ
jgi:thimet oligopeptidase